MTETYTLNLTYNHLVTIREAIRYKIEDTEKFLNDKGPESLANGRKGLANLNKIIAENELKEQREVYEVINKALKLKS